MPTVRAIGTAALQEIGVLAEGEGMSASQGAFILLRLQNLIDAWAADRLTWTYQARTVVPVPSGTSTVTLGPVGADVTMQRPVWVDAVSLLNPGPAPQTEIPLTLLDEAAYSAERIKDLTSTLPTQAFYQLSSSGSTGSLYVWPTPTQDVDLVLYTPQAVDVPATLDTVLTGPPGYQDAFMYQLAIRLCTPFGVPVPPLLPKLAMDALAVIKRLHVRPGQLAMDFALMGRSGTYNVFTDTW